MLAGPIPVRVLVINDPGGGRGGANHGMPGAQGGGATHVRARGG